MGEMIEVLDASGGTTGLSASRGEVHREGLWHRTVHIWVLNGKGGVLLQRRADSKENYPGAWDISAAGHISAGETSLEAARKELFEELGLLAGECDFEYVTSVASEAILNAGRYIDREWTDVYILSRDIPASSLTLQEAEVADAVWTSLADLAARVSKGDPLLVPHPEEYRIVLARLRAGESQ